MNGLDASLTVARDIAAWVEAHPTAARVALFPPATLIRSMSEALAGFGLLVGGQDCHPDASGAFTGDISAEMLYDAGARMVIVGHSERRSGHEESNGLVAAKSRAALRAGLEPIICVGEPLAERVAGRALDVLTRQLRGSLARELAGVAFCVAYEPIWAVGSGVTPNRFEIEEVNQALRGVLVDIFGAAGRTVPILYGGSVVPANARELLSTRDVGGALIGRASLTVADFTGILAAI